MRHVSHSYAKYVTQHRLYAITDKANYCRHEQMHCSMYFPQATDMLGGMSFTQKLDADNTIAWNLHFDNSIIYVLLQ